MYTCSHCGATVPDEEVDPDLGLFHCSACDQVSPIEQLEEGEPEGWEVGYDEPVSSPVAAPPVPAPLAPVGPPPRGWEEEAGSNLRLTRAWLGASILPLLLFTVIWNGVLVLFVIGGNVFVLCLPHGWVGVGMLYFLAANMLNRTTVAVERGDLIISNGPVPWWGNHQIPVNSIEQIWVTRSTVKVNKQARWNLMARVDGRERALMRLVETPAAAQWFERRLEHALGIVDKPMPHEVSKP